MAAKAKDSPPDERTLWSGDGLSRLPPLKALQAFEATARRGSFALGAEDLGVTPSAVSHQIQQLEMFLGVQLFARHAGRSSLTAAGQVYSHEITSAFRMMTRATEIVAPQSQAGHLAIACSPGFAAKWLQPRLSAFLGANADIALRLTTVSDLQELDKTRCDIAIVYGRPGGIDGVATPLLTERLMPLCSPMLLAFAGLRTLEDLARVTLIHSANALTWPEYFSRLHRHDIRPQREIWLDRSTIAIQAAIDGLGVILESEVLTHQELQDGRLVPVFDIVQHGVEAPSYFIHHPAGSGNRRLVGRFEEWLRCELATWMAKRGMSAISSQLK